VSVLRALSAGARWAREIRAGAVDPTGAWAALRADEQPVGEELAAAFGLDASSRALWVGRGGGAPLDDVTSTPQLVVLDRGIYATIPTAEARARLVAWSLEPARSLIAHVPASAAGAHLGRVVIDGARAMRRMAGAATPEPGDRIADAGGYVHAFFDEEALLRELSAAGAARVVRRTAWLYMHLRASPDDRDDEPRSPRALEVARVMALAPTAELLRRRASPEAAIARMRARGRDAEARGPLGRARLRDAIGWVDAALPGGGNCYRRTLIELGLDGGAAGEALVFGLDVGKTGHVAFKHREPMAFDVVFEVEP
jgi:hypothetical protein